MFSECRGLFSSNPWGSGEVTVIIQSSISPSDAPLDSNQEGQREGRLTFDGFLTRGLLPTFPTFSKDKGGTGSQREGEGLGGEEHAQALGETCSAAPALKDCSFPGQGGGRYGERGEVFICARKQLCMLHVLVTLQNLNYGFWENFPLNLEQSFTWEIFVKCN